MDKAENKKEEEAAQEKRKKLVESISGCFIEYILKNSRQPGTRTVTATKAKKEN